jgi:hypothetical protein
MDLLISLTRAAAKVDGALNPYPEVHDPDAPEIMLFDPKVKQMHFVNQVLDAFPTMEEASDTQQQMADAFARRNTAALPLLRWIIRSNTSHIEKLAPHRLLSAMETPHQFLLLTAPPHREAKFAAGKLLHGTEFAFHGSPVQYWHTILRTGLLNMSGTPGQKNGAAYGPGVYLSPTSGLSMGYSGMGMAGGGLQAIGGGGAFRGGGGGGGGGGAAADSGRAELDIGAGTNANGRFLNSGKMIVLALYGARFRTETCTRGCHWFPRLVA